MPKSRKSKDKCATKYCRNKAAVNNTGRKLALCWKCRSRLLKERHPLTYTLNGIRSRARRKRIPFTLTLSEFKKFCDSTGYLEHKGAKLGCLSVDRINRNEGYHAWNIRCLDFIENSYQGTHNAPRNIAASDEDSTDEPF